MIEFCKLTKRYGRMTALNAVDLHIQAGEIHGFVGPNGAGKTTALRILATLLRPTSGDARVDGVSVSQQPQEARVLVGYMPDFFGVYDNLKAWEYLELYAGCMGLQGAQRRRRIDAMLSLVELMDKREAYVDTLSRGMKQRLCLARALIHDPQVLLLDEPASGMDPHARAQMREVLKHVGEMGKTVVISSHILPEMSELCDHMTILEHGQVAFTGPLYVLQHKLRGQTLRMRLAGVPPLEVTAKMNALLHERCPGEMLREADGAYCFSAPFDEQADAALLGALLALGAPVCEFGRVKPTLEKVFMEVTGHESHL